MRLFFKKDKIKSNSLISVSQQTEIIDNHTKYEQTLDFLIGLSDKEFKQTVDVAKAHRKAYEDSAKILNVVNEPTTFIFDPADNVEVIRPVFVDIINTEQQNINVKTKKGKSKK